MDFDIPSNLLKSSKQTDTLPDRSLDRYKNCYDKFMKWQKSNGITTFDEPVLLAYFEEASKKYKPSSMWSTYSMLKSTIMCNHNINISGYNQLLTFLKKISDGFESENRKVFSADEINKFLAEAPDENYLAIKTVLVFVVAGRCKGIEITNIKTGDVTDYGNEIILRIPDPKTRLPKEYGIIGEYLKIVRKYMQLRPANVTTDRFFLNYQNGECSSQVIGRNKIANMPREIALFLLLPEWESYSSYSLRLTSATISSDSSAALELIKQYEQWESSEGYEHYQFGYEEEMDNVISEIINLASPTNASNRMASAAITNSENSSDLTLSSEASVASVTKEIGAHQQQETGVSLPDTLANKTLGRYKSTYDIFIKWQKSTGITTFDEPALLAYFDEASRKYRPSSLWSMYSMLKSTILSYNNINISGYTQLLAFLKKANNGYISTKFQVFSAEEVNKFLIEAPDDHYLAMKTVLVFGVTAGCRGEAIKNVKTSYITDYGSEMILRIPHPKTKVPNEYVISGEHSKIVQKYMRLRPPNVPTDRFFLQYANGECTCQVIGKHKIANMPKQIAKFLKLPDWESYSAHSLRRTSATNFADSCAEIETIEEDDEWEWADENEGCTQEDPFECKEPVQISEEFTFPSPSNVGIEPLVSIETAATSSKNVSELELTSHEGHRLPPSADNIMTSQPQEKVLPVFDNLQDRTHYRYNNSYDSFVKWQESKGITSFDEPALLAYFNDISKKCKPSSLASTFSMLKITIMSNHNINISGYTQLLAFLREINDGYVRTKFKTFSDEEIDRFLVEAPDVHYLAMKTVLVFGVAGGCRGEETTNIKTSYVTDYGTELILRIPNTKTKVLKECVISGAYSKVVQKYMQMRPPNVPTDRFFLHYQNGECTSKVIGRDKIANMPKQIARFLKLPEWESYNLCSFRRTSTTNYSDIGARMEKIEHLETTELEKELNEDPLEYKQKLEISECHQPSPSFVVFESSISNQMASSSNVSAENILELESSSDESVNSMSQRKETVTIMLESLQNRSQDSYKMFKVFTSEQIKKFLIEAPDDYYLAMKTVLVFGVAAECKGEEITNVKTGYVTDCGTKVIVRIPDTKTKFLKKHLISGEFAKIVQRYMRQRPANEPTDRFFLHYKNGECTSQVLGRDRVANVPKQIAKFLQLPEWESFTARSFRRTSHTIFTDSSAGPQQCEKMQPPEVAGGYIQEPFEFKRKNDSLFADARHLPSTSNADDGSNTSERMIISAITSSENLSDMEMFSDESMSSVNNINVTSQPQLLDTLQNRSHQRYKNCYDTFIKWQHSNGITSFDEPVLLAYFNEASKKYKPSSMTSIYSMLRSTLLCHHNMNISEYTRLLAYLKEINDGYIRTKFKTFTDKEIDKFIAEAPDFRYLAMKAVLVFGVTGGCRGNDIANIRTDYVTDYGNQMVVRIPGTKIKPPKEYFIVGDFMKIVRKYIQQRPANVDTDRFFLHYRNGECTSQVIGKNKVANVPKEIAKFLDLPEWESYNAYSFRRTSAGNYSEGGLEVGGVESDELLELTEGYEKEPLAAKQMTTSATTDTENGSELLLSDGSMSSANDTTVAGYIRDPFRIKQEIDFSESGHLPSPSHAISTNLPEVGTSLDSTMLRVDKLISHSQENASKLAETVQKTYKTYKVFSAEQIKKFLIEAPDNEYLAMKAVLVFGVAAECRGEEITNVKTGYVTDCGTEVIVRIPDPKTKFPKIHFVKGEYAKVVQKYMRQRPAYDPTDRFFLFYKNGECTSQVLGRDRVANMPKQIAKFLQLPQWESFTGRSFRRTSHTIFTNSGTGISEECEKRQSGEVPEVDKGHIQESLENKRKFDSSIGSADMESLSLKRMAISGISSSENLPELELLSDESISSVSNINEISQQQGTVSHVSDALQERLHQGQKHCYDMFIKWQNWKGISSFDEEVILNYFIDVSTKKDTRLPLKNIFSMLTRVLITNHNVNISGYQRVLGFLKKTSDGYRRTKFKIFSDEEIDKFLLEAPDDHYLGMKTVLVFGVAGGCTEDDIANMKTGFVMDYGTQMLVSIPGTQMEPPKEYFIVGDFLKIVQKYMHLRPAYVETDRFFLHYENGECASQVISKGLVANVPKEIAKFLDLPEWESYNAYSFRRTSAGNYSESGLEVESMESDELLELTEGYEKEPLAAIQMTTSATTDTENGSELLLSDGSMSSANDTTVAGYIRDPFRIKQEIDFSESGHLPSPSHAISTNLPEVGTSLDSTMLRVDKLISHSQENASKLAETVQKTYKTYKVFSAEQIKKFLIEAPDNEYLAMKAVLVFGVAAECRGEEITNVKARYVTDCGTEVIVRIPDPKTKFTKINCIKGEYAKVVQKYMRQRPPNEPTDRFFLFYKNGECTSQVLGRDRVANMPKQIAKFLQLPQWGSFTGRSFRRTSHTIFTNSGTGISEECEKRQSGEAPEVVEGKSPSFSETVTCVAGHIQESLENKRKFDSSIDETNYLRSSSADMESLSSKRMAISTISSSENSSELELFSDESMSSVNDINEISHKNVKTKFKTFSADEIDKFLLKAPDDLFLLMKTILLFEMAGACRGNDLADIKSDYVTDHGTEIIVRIPGSEVKLPKEFVIVGNYLEVIKKYMRLRPADVDADRFFLHYENGECTSQVIDKSLVANVPKEIAKFLELPEWESYDAYSLCITSATNSNETGSVIEMTDSDKQLESTESAEGHVEDRSRGKPNIEDVISDTFDVSPSSNSDGECPASKQTHILTDSESSPDTTVTVTTNRRGTMSPVGSSSTTKDNTKENQLVFHFHNCSNVIINCGKSTFKISK